MRVFERITASGWLVNLFRVNLDTGRVPVGVLDRVVRPVRERRSAEALWLGSKANISEDDYLRLDESVNVVMVLELGFVTPLRLARIFRLDICPMEVKAPGDCLAWQDQVRQREEAAKMNDAWRCK